MMNAEDFDQYVVSDVFPDTMGAHAIRFRFPNDYGASVIRGGLAAYGGFELAVIVYDDNTGNWNLCYDTPITDDVIGHLNEDTCLKLLNDIFELPHKHSVGSIERRKS